MKHFYFALIATILMFGCKKNTETTSPVISSISPSVGYAGNLLTISGTNFANSITGNIVKFNGTDAVVQNASPSTITVLVPQGASSGQITVTSNGKTSNGPSFTYADTAFSAFAPLSQAVPTGSIRGMDYDSVSKNLFIYVYDNSPGYSILQYNTATKTAITVGNYTGSWSNSNGSEGARIRVQGQSLYVMGGATNNSVHQWDGVGTNTLTLHLSWTLFSSGDPVYSAYFGEPYDVSIADRIYLMTMRSKITVFNTNHSPSAVMALKSSSHGSSVLYVSSGGNNYLVSTGGGTGIIEVRDPSSAQFLRSVTVPSPNGYTGLAKDGKGRVYYVSQGKIYRWSADLLSQETFQAKGSQEYSQFALAEQGNLVRIFMTKGVSVNNAGSSFGIVSMDIPD